MRIAQLPPLTEPIPPARYGGTERIVSYLTDELVRLGHDVTLFASGDSVTHARLAPVRPTSLGRAATDSARGAAITLLLERVFAEAGDFDIIHSHVDFVGFPLARRSDTPVLTTIHGRLDLPELRPIYQEFADLPLACASRSQAMDVPEANWRGVVPHGLPRDCYRFQRERGGYLAFLGRLTPEKAPDLAVTVAAKTGLPLKIAAKLDPSDRDYFEAVLRPLLDHPLVEYVGELTDREKQAFLGDALALVCPFQPEAFGLVLIEALACGTPVLTFQHGSYPDIVDHGVTGFLCASVDDMIERVTMVPLLDRADCRLAFERRFTAERMAQDYVALYESLIVPASVAPAERRRTFRSHGASPSAHRHLAHADPHHIRL